MGAEGHRVVELTGLLHVELSAEYTVAFSLTVTKYVVHAAALLWLGKALRKEGWSQHEHEWIPQWQLVQTTQSWRVVWTVGHSRTDDFQAVRSSSLESPWLPFSAAFYVAV